MKINVLDAHDRYESFTKKNFYIANCLDNLIKQKPFGDYPFYVFCHPRTDDDGVTKRYIYQPRLTKPKAQTNSALYKVKPGSDIIKVIWILPPREMWNDYQLGNVCENQEIEKYIHFFQFDRSELEKPEEEDPSPEKIQEILFEFQPQLFKKETLPEHLIPIWEKRVAQIRSKEKSG